MLTGELRNQIDGIWNDFWSGGLAKRRQQCDIADALALWRLYKARKVTARRRK